MWFFLPSFFIILWDSWDHSFLCWILLHDLFRSLCCWRLEKAEHFQGMALHKQLTNSCTTKPSWIKKTSFFLHPDAKILPVHSWDDKFIGAKCQYDLSSHLLQSWPYLKHSMHNCIMGTQLNWVKKHRARQDKIKAWKRERVGGEGLV